MTHQDGLTGLLPTPDLAHVLEYDRFRQFRDQVPIAIALSNLRPDEHICYANIEFERLTGRARREPEGKSW